MDYQELIERLRCEGDDVARDEAADAVESLLAENERLKHNLTSTEQTMREYQEIAAKRLEEIERLKEIEQTNDTLLDQLGDKNAALLDQVAEFKEENRIERNLRVGVEYGFECANEQIGLLHQLIDEQKAELAKYRDAPVVGCATTNEEGDLSMLFFDEQEARKYSGDDEPIKLIVKPRGCPCE